MIGIYALWFEKPSMVYIGQSHNIEYRYKEHIRHLQKDKHYNDRITKNYIKYGEPELVILEECLLQDLDIKEILWIEEFESVRLGLNISNGGQAGRGIYATGSKYHKITILKVLILLAKTNLSTRKIAKVTRCSKSLVSGIKNGDNHVWLKYSYPEMYEKATKRVISNTRTDISKELLYNKFYILKGFSLLYKTNFTYLEISNRIGNRLDIRQLQSIKYGEAHSWLKHQYPEQYLAMKRRVSVWAQPLY